MTAFDSSASSKKSPLDVLGVTPGASMDDIRAAYLARVKEHPPDRDPENFERIRDAYQALVDSRNPDAQSSHQLDPSMWLSEMLKGEEDRTRRFPGPDAWLKAISACGSANETRR